MSNYGQRGQHAYTHSKKSDRSLYLTEQEHNRLFELFSDRSYSLCTTIAQVLEGRQGRWILKDDGILCFVKDHQKKSFFLRLFNLNSMSVSWEMELYLEMAMNIPKDFFMTFDGDVCRIGVNFLKAEECSRMHQIINEKVCRRSGSQRARDYNNRQQQNNNGIQNGGYNPYQATINKHQNNQTLDKELKALGNVKQIPGNQMSKDHESQLNKQRKKRKKKDKRRIDKSQISVPVAGTFRLEDGYRKHAENPQKDPQNDPQTYLQNPAVRDLIIRAGVNEQEFLTSSEKQNHIYGFINTMGMEKIQMQYQRRTASIKQPVVVPDSRDRSQSATHNYPPPVPVNDYSSKTLPPQRAPPPIPSNPPTKHRPKKAPPPPPPGSNNRNHTGTLRKPTHALPPPPPVPGIKPSQIPNNSNLAPPPPPPPPVNNNPKFAPPQPLNSNHNSSNNFPPPPPPALKNQPPPPPPSKNNKPKIDDNRGALLSSIQNFKSTNLRKAESIPTAPRPISQTSDDGDMADQLKKHLEKIRIIREDSSSGDDTDTDSEWDD